MAFLKSLNISGSALTAQRVRMDVISENVANINTTRGADGQPYQRRFVVMQAQNDTSFKSVFGNALGKSSGNGVSVVEIANDESPFKLDYNPNHPDADEQGYVRMPNVEMVTETVDFMSATRSYEANITAINVIKGMAMKALEIGR